MTCLEPGLFLRVEQLNSGAKPLPLDSGFSIGCAYRTLGSITPRKPGRNRSGGDRRGAQYLRAVLRGVIDAPGGDPRLRVRVADGLKHVQNITEQYDLIILDLTDPGGPSQPMYTADFYQDCAALLKPGGILSLHVASPFAHQDRVVNTLTNLKQAFAIVRPYLVSVPLSGGPWMMACASDSLDPAMLAADNADARLANRRVTGLRYYNGCTHQAVMALPNFVRSAVASTGARLS